MFKNIYQGIFYGYAEPIYDIFTQFYEMFLDMFMFMFNHCYHFIRDNHVHIYVAIIHEFKIVNNIK